MGWMRDLLGGLLGPSNLLTPAIGLIILPFGRPLLCGAMFRLPDRMCRISPKFEAGISRSWTRKCVEAGKKGATTVIVEITGWKSRVGRRDGGEGVWMRGGNVGSAAAEPGEQRAARLSRTLFGLKISAIPPRGQIRKIEQREGDIHFVVAPLSYENPVDKNTHL